MVAATKIVEKIGDELESKFGFINTRCFDYAVKRSYW